MLGFFLLLPGCPVLDAKTKTCLAEGELSSRLDEQANRTVGPPKLSFFPFERTFLFSFKGRPVKS
jgi:hypothetical protein